MRRACAYVCVLGLAGCLSESGNGVVVDTSGADAPLADTGGGGADTGAADVAGDAPLDTGGDAGLADVADAGADTAGADTGGGDAGDEDAVVIPPTVLPRESRGSAVAITSDDKYVAMVNTDDGSVSVFNTATDSLLSRTKVGTAQSEPTQVVFGPDDSTLYVTLKADGAVARILDADTPDPTPDTPIATGSEAVGLALSPTGRWLFVANAANRTVSVIDAASWTWAYDVAVPGNPWAVAVTNDLDAEDDDETVYVTQFWSSPSGITKAALAPQSQGEGTDFGRKGVLYTIRVGQQTAGASIDLMPLDDVGFPNPKEGGTTPQGCFPNQLTGLAINQGRVYVPNTCAGPRGPVKFNVNMQGVVSVVDQASGQEIRTGAGTANLNAFVKGQSAEDAGRQFLTVPNDIAFVPGKTIGYVVSQASHLVLRVNYEVAEDAIEIGSTQNLHIPVGAWPQGIVISHDGLRGYVGNLVSRDLSIIDFASQTVVKSVPSTDKPGAGTEAFEVLEGKKFFNTSTARWSKESWGSCTGCHPGGLSDNVTWHFAAGPRQSVSMDGTFSKTDQTDQRILNWTGVFDEIHDFELNTRGVSGGKGAITDGTDTPIPLDTAPIGGGTENHQGLNGSAAFVAQTIGSRPDWDQIEAWSRTIRSPKAPTNLDPGVVAAGRAHFEVGGCAKCHGGAKWTISRRTYEPSIAASDFLKAEPLDTSALPPGQNVDTLNLAAEPAGGATIPPPRIACVLRNVGTFGDAAVEVKADMASIAQGQSGYNPPSLLGLVFGAPFLHNGAAETLEDLFSERFEAHHQAASANFLEGVDSDASEQAKRAELIAFLLSIDASTEPFAIPANAVICPTNVP